jgi:DNA polymerase I-like protein with 3'-5' exonuclease and polymerase domains
MSCRNPNAQQLNSRAKRLIHPPPGYSIVSGDENQIEFRIIVSYIGDENAIQSYNENPDTDFHQWVADLCGGIKRRPAKCLNFGMGFGAGRRKVIEMLSADKDVMADVGHKINDMIQQGTIKEDQRNVVFKSMCSELANNLYSTYHEKLPGIKATSQRASDVAKRRGYVFNGYGRRRHLGLKFTNKAFNSIVQSFAADILKDAAIKLAPRYNREARDAGIILIALVHDDITSLVPLKNSRDPSVLRIIKNALENPDVKIKVPVTCKMGFSDRNWAEASSDKNILDETGKIVAGPINFS